MIGPARSPCPATRTVTLRVELLDARCVPSATALDAPLLPSPILEMAHAAQDTSLAQSARELGLAPLQGPLMKVPADLTWGRDITIDWGDGVVTIGVLLPGLAGQAEVWTERELDADTRYQLTITMTGKTDVRPLVFQSEFFSGEPAAPDVTGVQPNPIEPEDDPTPQENRADARAAPPAVPESSAANPAPGAVLLPPLRSESPYQAGETQALAARSDSVRTPFGSMLAASPSVHPGAVDAVGGMAATVRTEEWMLAQAEPNLPAEMAEPDHAPIVVDGETDLVRMAAPEVFFPTPGDPGQISLIRSDASKTADVPAGALLSSLAAAPVPAAVFAAREASKPDRRPIRFSRGLALVVMAVVSYRTLAPRLPRRRGEIGAPSLAYHGRPDSWTNRV